MAQEPRRLTLEHVKSGTCLCGGEIRLTRNDALEENQFWRRLRYACFMCGRDFYIDPSQENTESLVA